MELILTRTYHADGTNGLLHQNGVPICFTIELPWRNNQPRVSCIPEGRYPLVKRYSHKFGNHLLVQNVPNRSLILFHWANNAAKDLQGCIAPVASLCGHGRGDDSRATFIKLVRFVCETLDKGDTVFLVVEQITKAAE